MSGGKILIVEDQRIVARDLQLRLERFGYQVVDMVSTGEGAIRAVDQHRPDLVLMDILLEGAIDGIEAAEVIQRNFKTPVIYVTAHADQETYDRAQWTRPAGYLIKPFEDAELKSSLQSALKEQEPDGAKSE